jgi:hypothetical protein
LLVATPPTSWDGYRVPAVGVLHGIFLVIVVALKGIGSETTGLPNRRDPPGRLPVGVASDPAVDLKVSSIGIYVVIALLFVV